MGRAPCHDVDDNRSQPIDELWTPFANAYFDDGRNTAGIRFCPSTAPTAAPGTTPTGRIGNIISMREAKFGDAKESGESGAVAL